MILIDCPWCGPRNHDEFSYYGDASVERPSGVDPDSETAWLDYVYRRDNPRGEHSEYWQHIGGCRAWLKVRRNTVTHEVIQVTIADSRFAVTKR